MAYDDKDQGTIFPTRFGEPTGTANERKMLDVVGGSQGIRTRLQIAADGLQTLLKTRAGMPRFINKREKSADESSVSSVRMDSGAVDLVSVAESSPDAGADAVLWYGTLQRTYAGLKKLLGKIIPPSVKNNNPPAEGAAANSFYVGADSLGVRDATLVGMLYQKKVCAAYCPASMFTGKARFFAQAQYGATLKRWKWDLTIPPYGPPRLVHENGYVLMTSCGVYRDSEFNHWILRMDDTGVTVTKLKRDAAVKPLVSLLAGDPESEKIEGYILAYSTPDPTLTFHIDIPGVPLGDMLGYGWKFNWDGNKADIIQITDEPATITLTYFRSRHYRVTFNRNAETYVPSSLSATEGEKTRWTAVLSLVEDSGTWHNAKWGDVISYPDWSLYQLKIFGTLAGGRSGNAPVYCFYKRDGSLEVIRYSGSDGASSVKYERVSDPPMWIGVHTWSVTDLADVQNYGSMGPYGAYGERRMRTHNPTTAGFVTTALTAQVTSNSYSYNRYSFTGKTFGEPTSWQSPPTPWNLPGNTTTVVLSTVDTGISGADGVHLYSSSGTTVPYQTIPGKVSDQGGNVVGSILIDTSFDGTVISSGAHSETGRRLVIIPFQDAEAAYVRASLLTERSESGITGSKSTPTGTWCNVIDVYEALVGGGYSFFGRYFGYSAHSESLQIDYDTAVSYEESSSNEAVICSALITSSGDADFSPPESLAPFFAGEASGDWIPRQYFTHSSIQGAIFGHGAESRQGFKAFDSPPPFIGWA